MRYRQVPRTDIQVSEIGLDFTGTCASMPGRPGAEQVRDLAMAALDLGVTLLTVTDVTDAGESERLLGTALGRRRHEAVIAARGGYDWYQPAHLRRDGKAERDFTMEYVRKACEGSLLRLKTDYIDLYLLHHPGMRALESEGLFELLKDLRREGKVREYGAHLGPGLDWDEEGEMAMKERKLPAVQASYNMFQQKPVRLFFPLATQHQCAIIADDPLAAGALDRFPAPGAPADARLRELAFLKRNYDLTLAQAALRFCLAEPAVVSALVQAGSGTRPRELAAASDARPLETTDIALLRDLYDAGLGVKSTL